MADLEQRLLEGKTTAYEKQLCVQEYKKYGQGLLERLICITQFFCIM
jgi:hypothetical protein